MVRLSSCPTEPKLGVRRAGEATPPEATRPTAKRRAQPRHPWLWSWRQQPSSNQRELQLAREGGCDRQLPSLLSPGNPSAHTETSAPRGTEEPLWGHPPAGRPGGRSATNPIPHGSAASLLPCRHCRQLPGVLLLPAVKSRHLPSAAPAPPPLPSAAAPQGERSGCNKVRCGSRTQNTKGTKGLGGGKK